MEKARWVWSESTKELVLDGDAATQSRYRRRLRGLRETRSVRNHSPGRVVTLEDVKRVAVDQMDSELLTKMPDDIVELFDHCYRTDTFNDFLWNILKYYQSFLNQKEASEDEAVDIPGILGESARETLTLANRSLREAESSLGLSYAKMVSGIGMEFAHHSLQGRLKFSRTHSDSKLFEAIYEFTMCVTWVAFGYSDWQTIHTELGRILRTSAFNRDLKDKQQKEPGVSQTELVVPEFADDEHLSEKMEDRPARGLLKCIKTPVLDTWLSQPSTSVFNYSPSTSEKQNVGIIGQPMYLYHPSNLKLLTAEQ